MAELIGDIYMACKRCGKEIESGEIHIFRYGEERRRTIEKIYKTKVTLCTNPPPLEFWKEEIEI